MFAPETNPFDDPLFFCMTLTASAMVKYTSSKQSSVTAYQLSPTFKEQWLLLEEFVWSTALFPLLRYVIFSQEIPALSPVTKMQQLLSSAPFVQMGA